METAITLTYEVELQFLDAGGEVTGEGTATIADVATGRSALFEARSDSEAPFVRCKVSASSARD